MSATHTAQSLAAQTDRGSTRPTTAAVGDRFGELTIVRLIGTREADGARLWECVCDCGGGAIRTTSSLAKSVRDGVQPACASCTRELRGGAYFARMQGEFWTVFYQRFGTCWPAISCERLGASVARDLELVGHRAPTDAPLPVPPQYTPEMVEDAGGVAARVQQRIADLYPLAKPGYEWLCEHCRAMRPRVFGCVQCGGVACVRCVRDERHAHREDSLTLEEIGGALHYGDGVGVSRERARQIIERALRKLRRQERLRILTGERNRFDGVASLPALADDKLALADLNEAAIASDLGERRFTRAEVARRNSTTLAIVDEIAGRMRAIRARNAAE